MPNLLFISNIANKITTYSRGPIMAANMNSLLFHFEANWGEGAFKQIKSDESEYRIKIHNVNINRSPVSLNNLKALKKTKEIIQKEHIDFIHCNTPAGGIIGRLLNKNVRKVIYEVHGLHFYKGAPIKNWLIYYPMEKLLSRKNDAIITINREDYEFAKKHLHSKAYYVPGVGIELQQWEIYKDGREKYRLKDDDFVILVVGRLEKNKNCRTVIEAVSKIPQIKLIFCGNGEDLKMLKEKAESLEVEDRVIFLGNQNNMSDIYHMADCFVMASYREGLSRSIMEAMACGLPCIVSDIRGNRDLIDKDGGFLFNPTDVDGLAEKIKAVRDSQEIRKRMGEHNKEKIKEFSFDKVVNDLSNIYAEVFELEKVQCR